MEEYSSELTRLFISDIEKKMHLEEMIIFQFDNKVITMEDLYNHLSKQIDIIKKSKSFLTEASP